MVRGPAESQQFEALKRGIATRLVTGAFIAGPLGAPPDAIADPCRPMSREVPGHGPGLCSGDAVALGLQLSQRRYPLVTVANASSPLQPELCWRP
jgi:hypothetical protein